MTITNPRLIKFLSACHSLVYAWTGGRIGGKRHGTAPVLLLTTSGWRTGKSRTSPLIYLRDGDSYVVAASYAGNERGPSWWSNLRRQPRARIQVGARAMQVHARQVAPSEEEELWPRLDGIFTGYAIYRARATRHIPLVRLEPVS